MRSVPCAARMSTRRPHPIWCPLLPRPGPQQAVIPQSTPLRAQPPSPVPTTHEYPPPIMDQSIKIAQDALADPSPEVAETLAKAPAEAQAAIADLKKEATTQPNGTSLSEGDKKGMDAKLQVGKSVSQW